MFGMSRQQVKQVTTASQLCYYKEFIVDAKNVVQTNDVVVSSQLAQDIDFFLQLGNVLWIVAKHDALAGKLFPLSRSTGLVSFRFTPGRDADLTVGALANDQVSVKEIGRSALRRIGSISDMILCGRVIGDCRGRKGWLQTFGAGSAGVFVVVKGCRVIGTHGSLLLWWLYLLRLL